MSSWKAGSPETPVFAMDCISLMPWLKSTGTSARGTRASGSRAGTITSKMRPSTER
jgi:hypothetical protein